MNIATVAEAFLLAIQGTPDVRAGWGRGGRGIRRRGCRAAVGANRNVGAVNDFPIVRVGATSEPTRTSRASRSLVSSKARGAMSMPTH